MVPARAAASIPRHLKHFVLIEIGIVDIDELISVHHRQRLESGLHRNDRSDPRRAPTASKS